MYIPIYSVALIKEARLRTQSLIVDGPELAAALFMERIGSSDREVFVVLGLSVKNRAIGLSEVSRGTLDAAVVHPREVYKAALLMNAACIIVGHCHPSGDPEPSPEDRRVTERLSQAGKILGVELADHIVVAGSEWVSLRLRGMI